MNAPDAPTPTAWFDSWRAVGEPPFGRKLRIAAPDAPETTRAVLEPADWSGRAASDLSRTLHRLERHGLVKPHRSPDTRAVRPEALATEFLVVRD